MADDPIEHPAFERTVAILRTTQILDVEEAIDDDLSHNLAYALEGHSVPLLRARREPFPHPFGDPEVDNPLDDRAILFIDTRSTVYRQCSRPSLDNELISAGHSTSLNEQPFKSVHHLDQWRLFADDTTSDPFDGDNSEFVLLLRPPPMAVRTSYSASSSMPSHAATETASPSLTPTVLCPWSHSTYPHNSP
jgi:hypothetical protein